MLHGYEAGILPLLGMASGKRSESAFKNLSPSNFLMIQSAPHNAQGADIINMASDTSCREIMIEVVRERPKSAAAEWGHGIGPS